MLKCKVSLFLFRHIKTNKISHCVHYEIKYNLYWHYCFTEEEWLDSKIKLKLSSSNVKLKSWENSFLTFASWELGLLSFLTAGRAPGSPAYLSGAKHWL